MTQSRPYDDLEEERLDALLAHHVTALQKQLVSWVEPGFPGGTYSTHDMHEAMDARHAFVRARAAYLYRDVPEGVLEISGNERCVVGRRPYYDRRVIVEVGHAGRRYRYEVHAADLTAAAPFSGRASVDDPEWDPIAGEGATHGRHEDGLLYTGPGVGPASAHQAAVEAYRLVARWLHAAGVDTLTIQRPWPGQEPTTTKRRRR